MDSEETEKNQSYLDKLKRLGDSDPSLTKRINEFKELENRRSANGYVSPPEIKNPTPVQRADEMARRLAYSAGGFVLEHYKAKQQNKLAIYEAEQREKALDFQVYDSLEEIVLEWPSSTTTMVEVKFIKPAKLLDWKSTIIQCSTMVKVFKTLDYFMMDNTHQFNFIYECRTLFKKTTHIFEYDPTNFAFVVRTGLGSGGQIIKNTPVSFHNQVRQQLHDLLVTMKEELPSTHYEQFIALYTHIKDKRKALFRQ